MYTGKLVFATNNAYKMQEAKHILPPTIHLLTLKDIACNEELPETHETLEENAFEKATHVFNHYRVNCFSEDTGLEVDALNGEPGVYSARFAGPGKSFSDNINLLLAKMKGVKNRRARFRAVIALIIDGNHHLFEGVVNGNILEQQVGKTGFGYDPLFQPDGCEKSFAQMSLDEKSQISHRKKALDGLLKFLHNYEQKNFPDSLELS